MAENPASIHQFRALAALERALARPEVRARALERLDTEFDLTDATVAGVEQTVTAEAGAEDPLTHLREHWLSGRYFPSIDAEVIADTLRSGFRDALQAAGDLPVVPVWVCATDDPEASVFRVDHVTTPTAVVVAIITPRPAGR